jgi:hypothetical protein
MITMAFLLLAADPSGLSEALMSADRADVFDCHRRASITLSGGKLKRLAKLVDCKDDVRVHEPGEGAIAAALVFEIRVFDKEGKILGKFGLVNDELVFDGKKVTLANRELYLALREPFEGPRARNKPSFVPKLSKELITEGEIVCLMYQPGGILRGADAKRNCLTSFGGGLYRITEFPHDKLTAPHAISGTENFVYLAGSSGIAGFRRISPGGNNVTPSEFVPENASVLHATDGKLYAGRKGEICTYDIVGKEGRLQRRDRKLTHALLEQPIGMASAKDFLYVVTSTGSLLTFQAEECISEESAPFAQQDDGERVACLAIDREKLFTVGIGDGLAAWNIADGKPVLVGRVSDDDAGARKMRTVNQVVVAGGRVWVAGYAGDMLAWFEWEDDELVFGGSKDFGKIRSLVANPVVKGSVQYLYAACENSVKQIKANELPNPLAPPEPP